MQPTQDEFDGFLEAVHLRGTGHSGHRQRDSRCRTAADLEGTLARQIGSSVRWLDSVLYLLDRGVTDFAEVGPGNVLTKLIAQIRKRRPA